MLPVLCVQELAAQEKCSRTFDFSFRESELHGAAGFLATVHGNSSLVYDFKVRSEYQYDKTFVQ